MDGVNILGWDRLTREALWFGVPVVLLANVGMGLRYCWPRRPGQLRATAALQQRPHATVQPVLAEEVQANAMAHAVAAARASSSWAGGARTERIRRRAAMRVMGTALRQTMYERGSA